VVKLRVNVTWVVIMKRIIIMSNIRMHTHIATTQTVSDNVHGNKET